MRLGSDSQKGPNHYKGLHGAPRPEPARPQSAFGLARAGGGTTRAVPQIAATYRIRHVDDRHPIVLAPQRHPATSGSVSQGAMAFMRNFSSLLIDPYALDTSTGTSWDRTGNYSRRAYFSKSLDPLGRAGQGARRRAVRQGLREPHRRGLQLRPRVVGQLPRLRAHDGRELDPAGHVRSRGRECAEQPVPHRRTGSRFFEGPQAAGSTSNGLPRRPSISRTCSGWTTSPTTTSRPRRRECADERADADRRPPAAGGSPSWNCWWSSRSSA